MQNLSSRALALAYLIFALAVISNASNAQQTAHPARGLQLESIEWRSDEAEFLDKQRFKTSLTVKERKFDRMQLLDSALSEAKKTQKPVLVYVYKISEKTKRGRQMIRAPVLDVYMRQLIWSDPDVERIVKKSFIAVRTVFDDALCKRFDVKPLKFLEPAILFLSSDGDVLHELRTIRTFDAPWIAQVLRDVLDKAHGPLVSDNLDAAVNRGDWQRALAILQSNASGTARDAYEQATIKRRLRNGDAALATLDIAQSRLQDEAKSSQDSDKAPPVRRRRGRGRRLPKALQQLDLEIAAERGALLIQMARFDDAVTPLMKAADANPTSWGDGKSRRAEARYRLALLRLRAGDESGALRSFQRIVQDEPDSLYARRAGVNLRVGIDDGLSLGAPMFGYERLAWLPEGAYTKLAGNTHWQAEPFTEQQLIDNCVRTLLAQQRSHGGWTDSRYAYCPDARITPNVWVAITAICCQALHRSRDQFVEPELIDAALARGEDYMLDPNQLNRGRNEDVYSDCYRLMYLSHRCKTAPDASDQTRWIAAMDQIVAAARERQKDGGFWAHEYSNAFCTAAMVQGLLAAKDAGTTIPLDMLSQATTALTSARSSDGAFSYSGAARGRLSATNLKNASTRMPMCEAALLTLGASDTDRLAVAFDAFWQHYPKIEGVRHTDFHADGQIAGFMFMHSLYHTSEAISLLPEDRASQERTKLREQLWQYPEIDGTFLDSEELGRSYGTAMALLIVANTR